MPMVIDDSGKQLDVKSTKTAMQQSLNLNNDGNGDNEIVENIDGIKNVVQSPKGLIWKYGILQEIVIQSSDEDAFVKAQRTLDDNALPEETIQVECIGDLNYQVGYGVHLKFPWYKKYEDCFMYIKDVSNTWNSDGTFISTLTLTPSRVMDEMEWDSSSEDETNEDDNGLASITTGELIDRIIAFAKTLLGVPYVRGGTDPVNGMDCSGFTQYVYNHFKDETQVTLTRTTYTQCVQGKEVDKTDKSKWAKGDLIFFTGTDTPPSHVGIYLGDNKYIHAPHTGDVIKISELTRTDIYSVRRIVKTETVSSSKGKGISLKSGLKLSGNYFTESLVPYIKVCEGFDSNATYNNGWVIGYGLTFASYPQAFNHGASAESNITKAEAEKWCRYALNEKGKVIYDYMTKNGYALAPYQMDGLISLSYLCGDITPVMRAIVENFRDGKKNNILQIMQKCAGKFGNGYVARVNSDYRIFSTQQYVPYNS